MVYIPYTPKDFHWLTAPRRRDIRHSNRVIGSDKIGFIECDKYGSTSILSLLKGRDETQGPKDNEYDFISTVASSSCPDKGVEKKEDYPSERILLFPWRDEFESVKSGFLQDVFQLNEWLRYSHGVTDKVSIQLGKYIFSKKSNVNEFFIGNGWKAVHRFPVPTVNMLGVNMGHKQLLINQDFFKYFLTDYDKFYFFDLKHLSNPKLIEWISEHDSRWKNISIPHKNTTAEDEGKTKIKEILFQIKEELGEDYLDYEDIENWRSFKHYYEFSKMFFESRKESKQFLNFD